MNISIFGMGYVGCVCLGCLAQDGHNIVGVDINKTKVDMINNGNATIIEKDIDKIIKKQHELKKIRATSDYKEAVLSSEISIIAVGTPSTDHGHLNLDYIFNTAKNIGNALKNKNEFHIISIRSTVLPSTNEKVGSIIEKISNKKRNVDFAVVSNPEFLREGSAVKDFYNPAFTVLGSDNEEALKKMKLLFSSVKAPFKYTGIKTAELIKYVNNSFHALKIAFANEIGNICNSLNIDSHELMDLFAADDKLNTSKAYLKPGFAYGGSCLPKDLKGLNTIAHDFYLETPVLNAIDISNKYQIDLVSNFLINSPHQKIGIFGISFKAGTDDLRFSPIVEVIERLIGKGKYIYVFDHNVHLAKLIGKNKSYIMEKLPHLSTLMVGNPEELIEKSELIVLTNKDESFEKVHIPANKSIYDLARNDSFQKHPQYKGISW